MEDASELTRFAENQLQEVILASDLEERKTTGKTVSLS